MTIDRFQFVKVLALCVFLFTFLFIALPSLTVEAVDIETESFQLEKKISDNKTSNPYSPDDFSFQIVGNGYDENVTLGTPGGGISYGYIDLPPGEYTVTEVGPLDFVPEDWTVQWSGYGCENKNSYEIVLFHKSRKFDLKVKLFFSVPHFFNFCLH